MELTENNKQYIYEIILEGKEPSFVNRIIMYYSKCKFRDACMYRYKAVEWLQNEENKEQVLSCKKEQDECKKEQRTFNESEEEDSFFQEEFDVSAKETSDDTPAKVEESKGCVSCGCKDYSCGCDIKRLSDIPF